MMRLGALALFVAVATAGDVDAGNQMADRLAQITPSKINLNGRVPVSITQTARTETTLSFDVAFPASGNEFTATAFPMLQARLETLLKMESMHDLELVQGANSRTVSVTATVEHINHDDPKELWAYGMLAAPCGIIGQGAPFVRYNPNTGAMTGGGGAGVELKRMTFENSVFVAGTTTKRPFYEGLNKCKAACDSEAECVGIVWGQSGDLQDLNEMRTCRLMSQCDGQFKEEDPIATDDACTSFSCGYQRVGHAFTKLATTCQLAGSIKEVSVLYPEKCAELCQHDAMCTGFDVNNADDAHATRWRSCFLKSGCQGAVVETPCAGMCGYQKKASLCDEVTCTEPASTGDESCLQAGECISGTGGCSAPSWKAVEDACDDGKPDTTGDKCYKLSYSSDVLQCIGKGAQYQERKKRHVPGDAFNLDCNPSNSVRAGDRFGPKVMYVWGSMDESDCAALCDKCAGCESFVMDRRNWPMVCHFKSTNKWVDSKPVKGKSMFVKA